MKVKMKWTWIAMLFLGLLSKQVGAAQNKVSVENAEIARVVSLYEGFARPEENRENCPNISIRMHTSLLGEIVILTPYTKNPVKFIPEQFILSPEAFSEKGIQWSWGVASFGVSSFGQFAQWLNISNNSLSLEYITQYDRKYFKFFKAKDQSFDYAVEVRDINRGEYPFLCKYSLDKTGVTRAKKKAAAELQNQEEALSSNESFNAESAK